MRRRLNDSKFRSTDFTRSAILGNLRKRSLILHTLDHDDLVVPSDACGIEATRQAADYDRLSAENLTQQASHAIVACRVVIDHRRVSELLLDRSFDVDHLESDAAALELRRDDETAFAAASIPTANVPRVADCQKRDQLFDRTRGRSAIAEKPRDALCQLKSCQLLHD